MAESLVELGLIFSWSIKLLIILIVVYKLRLNKVQKHLNPELKLLPINTYPNVCIQLPVYNEAENIKDLLNCISTMEWPKNRLEIQLLDDSTDETSKIAKKILDHIGIQNPKLNIQHIRRDKRIGYKAGALNEGLKISNADFFAIFDADFRPNPCFLKKMIPHFRGNKIAAIQAAWSYKNSSENILTRIQKIFLNGHFYLEQNGRYLRDLPFNFNGTGGIWRGSVLRELGGWSSKTVTEDLYLSYIAQLKGYKLVFVSDQSVLSEIPNNINSFMVQQKRWAKGNGQTLRLLGGRVLKSAKFTFKQKIDVLLHLAGYGISSTLLLFYFLLPVMITIRYHWLNETTFWSLSRIIDSSIWALLIFLIIKLYSLEKMHQGEDLFPKERIYEAIKLLLSAPVIGWIPFMSYWHGFITGKSKNSKYKIFHRTPKSSTKTKKIVIIMRCFLTVFFLLSSLYALMLDQILVALVLAGQLLVLNKVFKEESNKIAKVNRKICGIEINFEKLNLKRRRFLVLKKFLFTISTVLVGSLFSSSAISSGWVKKSKDYYLKYSIASSDHDSDVERLSGSIETVRTKEFTHNFYGELGLPGLPWNYHISVSTGNKSIERNSQSEGDTFKASSMTDAVVSLKHGILDKRFLDGSSGFLLALVTGMNFGTTPSGYRLGDGSPSTDEIEEDRKFLETNIDKGTSGLIYGLGTSVFLKSFWLNGTLEQSKDVSSDWEDTKKNVSLGTGLPFNSWAQVSYSHNDSSIRVDNVVDGNTIGKNTFRSTSKEIGIGLGATIYKGFAIELGATEIKIGTPDTYRAYNIGISKRTL